LSPGLKLGFAAPKSGEAAYDEYVSDPAKPVPYRRRPVQPVGYGDGMTWSQWLVDDQREQSGRGDVLAFVSDVLTAQVKISGQPVANLIASTGGTDSDWVVKLIDVYPDEVAGQPAMGGYQLMVSADIFRGRYCESFETPKAIAPTSRSFIASRFPTQIMSSSPATASWSTSSPPGFRSTTAIPRRSLPTFSGPSLVTIAKPPSASTMRPAKQVSLSCRWSPHREA